jgi:hypothetical protein
MPFSEPDRAILLAVKGVGPIVLLRLEQFGIADLPTLARQEADMLCAEISRSLGSTCWRNSPLARKSIREAIAAAKQAS